MTLVRLAACVAVGTACLAPTAADAADLKPASIEAYDKYAATASREFLGRAQKLASGSRCDGVMSARAGGGDGIHNVPDGLVHHWVGTAFVKGATVRQVSAVARDYASYAKVYESVRSAKVISQQGDDYRVLIRLREGVGRITAVLDVRSSVTYRPVNSTAVLATSQSEEIRQIENDGRPDEKILPAGRDDGYLWRAHTFTYFGEGEGGVFVVMETLGLTRRFPRGSGWLFEPIARRLGRKSVEGSLGEFLAAIRRTAGLPAVRSSSCN